MDFVFFLVSVIALVVALAALKRAGNYKLMADLNKKRIRELERRLRALDQIPPDLPTADAPARAAPVPTKLAPQPARVEEAPELQAQISTTSARQAKASAPPAPTHSPRPAAAARTPLAQPPAKKPEFDWEGIIGVKLFSWVAGVALLLAAIFFLRYSIDRGWLTAPIRVALGTAVGILLLLLCEMKAARRYSVTANAMDASAISILFATFYAAHAFWHLIGATAAFAALALVTTVAVLLSIRRDSLFVALLGLLGGFASPALLATGENRPFTLFGYLLLLNGGLAWVAARKKWPLLAAVSVVLTACYQWGWVARFLTADQLPLAGGIFLVFPILNFAVLGLGERSNGEARGTSLREGAAELSAFLPVLFAIYTASVPAYGARYWILFILLFLLDAGLFAIATARRRDILHAVGGISTLLVFAIWFLRSYEGGMLRSILPVVAWFVVFYLCAPLLARRLGKPTVGVGAMAVFTAPLLLPFLAVGPGPDSLALLLPVLLGLDFAAGVSALLLRRPALLIAAMAASALDLIIWAARGPESPWPALIILSAAALALFSLVLMRIGRRTGGAESFWVAAAATLFLAQIVAIGAALGPSAPGIGFLLAAHLAFLAALLALACSRGAYYLSVAAVLPATVAVSLWMHGHGINRFWSSQLLFASAIYAVFATYPLLLGSRAGKSWAPHLGAVLASAAFFFQVRSIMIGSGFGNIIGILPLFQAVVMGVLLLKLLAMEPAGERDTRRLALVAGSALAFVTVAIPLQLDKYWITLGWALEGAALAWLFRRIPHRGLLYWTTALLGVVFVRLALNPQVLVYAPRGTVPIWNWYLYGYLVSAAAMIVAGRMLAKTRDIIFAGLPRVSFLLPAGGTVLLFLLLNIEIADFYSTGATIDFNFTATLAQDLTYTLGWALFAVTLLAVGIAIRSHPARIAALGLLAITIFKCFLHDLARLGGLYRVASFVGLAVCLTLVAMALQKFVLAARNEIAATAGERWRKDTPS